jgi:hypothetical protein
MAIAKRWYHRIDGVDLNDAVVFNTRVPEAETEFGAQTRLTDMQARTPVFDRQQPVAGRYTFLTQILWDTHAEYLANLALLKSLVGPGIHTYNRARPGADDAGESVQVYFETGLVVDDTDVGYTTAKAIAPDPTWT